jgi:hypothetical protein
MNVAVFQPRKKPKKSHPRMAGPSDMMGNMKSQ